MKKMILSLITLGTLMNVELDENLFTEDSHFHTDRQQSTLLKQVSRGDSVDLDIQLNQAYQDWTDSYISRTAIHFSHPNQHNSSLANMEQGNVYVFEGYFSHDGEPLTYEDWDTLFSHNRSSNGFLHDPEDTVLLERHVNDSTGYIREVYRAEGNLTWTAGIHSLTRGQEAMQRFVGETIEIRNFSVREVLNAEGLGW